jgi:hypothetical protein
LQDKRRAGDDVIVLTDEKKAREIALFRWASSATEAPSSKPRSWRTFSTSWPPKA